jgi:hypothetical protein
VKRIVQAGLGVIEQAEVEPDIHRERGMTVLGRFGQRQRAEVGRLTGRLFAEDVVDVAL